MNFSGWATSLSAGESDWTSDFSFFKVVIDLTDAGQGMCRFSLHCCFFFLVGGGGGG